MNAQNQAKNTQETTQTEQQRRMRSVDEVKGEGIHERVTSPQDIEKIKEKGKIGIIKIASESIIYKLQDKLKEARAEVTRLQGIIKSKDETIGLMAGKLMKYEPDLFIDTANAKVTTLASEEKEQEGEHDPDETTEEMLTCDDCETEYPKDQEHDCEGVRDCGKSGNDDPDDDDEEEEQEDEDDEQPED